MSITPTPTIDVLPAAPLRSDSDPAFVAKSEVWVAAQPTFRAQLVAVAAAVEANGMAAETAGVLAEAAAVTALGATNLVATSNTPMTMVAGTKAVTWNGVSANIAFANGEIVVAQRLGDPNTKLVGEVQARAGLNFDFVVGLNGVINPSGGGPYSDWSFVSARFYASGASKAQVLAAISADVPMTPLSSREALEPYALSDTPTIGGFSGLNGLDFTLTIGGSRTLPALTNTYPGARGKIKITQDGTGGRALAYVSGSTSVEAARRRSPAAPARSRTSSTTWTPSTDRGRPRASSTT